jgi:hypothetical protein
MTTEHQREQAKRRAVKDATRKLALTFAEARFPIVPVNVFRRGERWRKQPYFRDWQNVATTDANKIRLWWDRWPWAMPGVPLSRCGIVVVDCDRHGGPDGVKLFRALGPLPPHPIFVTKSGGEHHWFRQPAVPIRFVKWAGGEVLGNGRFVVGYAVPEGPIPELPEVFCHLTINHLGVTAKADRYVSAATPRECVYGPPSRYEMNYADVALRNAVGELWMCREGSRNVKLNALAYNMGRLIVRGWIPRDRVESYLMKCCEANGLLADDGLAQCRATLASGINAGMKRPTTTSTG